jgi:Protein of unknown function (DUF1569)
VNPRLKRLQERIATVLEVPPEQFAEPARGKWCVAEILEHLYLTYTGTIKGFERLAERGKPVITAATWKQRLGKLVVVEFGYLPPGREAPSTARPRAIPREQVRAQIVTKISDMDQAIEHCEQKFGGKIKLLDHPILGPLSGIEWRKFHLVHGLHHIRQIQRLGGQPAAWHSKI